MARGLMERLGLTGLRLGRRTAGLGLARQTAGTALNLSGRTFNLIRATGRKTQALTVAKELRANGLTARVRRVPLETAEQLVNPGASTRLWGVYTGGKKKR